mgnify:CR=1 FL=1
MTTSVIDFSAQFGGRDAAAAVLPHFHALKAAAGHIRIGNFPFPRLAYVFRVDGEIRRYGFSGIDNPDIDRKKCYISFDIGITQNDRLRLFEVISSAIITSLSNISELSEFHSWGISIPEIRNSLEELVKSYKSELIKAGIAK